MRALTLVLLLVTSAVCASAQPTSQDPAREIDKALVDRLLRMLDTMQRGSRRDALRIRQAYRPLIERTIFDDRRHLQRALESGELVRLPRPDQFGIRPRLTGRSAIGGLDLEHQDLYVTARPAAMGMLLEIARRVRSGPLEVTSMVRSRAYQRALLGRNANAGTDVPTHAMGYAVDIGLLFTPMETAREIRRVLEQMRAAGRIYFIGERAQLAFHIVPVPSRFGEFERAYTMSVSTDEPEAERKRRVQTALDLAGMTKRGVVTSRASSRAARSSASRSPGQSRRRFHCGRGTRHALREPLTLLALPSPAGVPP